VKSDTSRKRLSAPESKKVRVQRIVLALLLDKEANGEIPTNGRFVFYELEQQGNVRKSRKGESRRERGDELPREQTVTDALIWLRDKGVIPWDWIADETRTVYGYDRPESVTAALRGTVEYAQINPWPGAPPLVLCESRSLSGVLRAVVDDEYRAQIAATNGQVGGFLRTEIAPLLADAERDVFYMGDLDHQGAQIEDNTRRVLEHLLGRELGWTRIAITPEQVAERDLLPMLKVDNRYRPPLHHEAWEAEALTQRVVVALVREALAALLPEPLADVLERERAEREMLRARLGELADDLEAE
jgi:hypothetical protein